MPVKVIHIITKLELGGAQQNTIFTVTNLNRSSFCPMLWSGPGGILTEDTEKALGSDFKLVPHLFREVNPNNDFLALLDLIRMLKAEKKLSTDPIIVHTHSSKAGILGRIAAWLAGIPIVIHTFHGFGFNDFQSYTVRMAYILVEKITAWATDGFIFVSRANIDKARRLGIGKPSQYNLIRSGIDISSFGNRTTNGKAFRGNLGVSKQDKLVAMVACFKPQKSPVDFARVAKIVLNAVPEAYFIMAGDGELRPQVESAVEELGIKDRFKLLGWRRDIPEILWASDLLVLTSLWEGLPRVFPQAMAAGLPIVGTRVDGGPEAVMDGENGYLLPPRDYQAIADRVIELLRDDGKRAKMGKRGSELVQEFDIWKMVRDQEQLYLRLLKEKNL